MNSAQGATSSNESGPSAPLALSLDCTARWAEIANPHEI